MSLNSGGTFAHNAYVYFLMSMKSALKLLDAYIYFLTSMKSALKLLNAGLFFNELEPCGNIARGRFIF